MLQSSYWCNNRQSVTGVGTQLQPAQSSNMKDMKGIPRETAHSPTLSKAAMCGSAKAAEPNSRCLWQHGTHCGGVELRAECGRHVLGWLALHSGASHKTCALPVLDHLRRRTASPARAPMGNNDPAPQASPGMPAHVVGLPSSTEGDTTATRLERWSRLLPIGERCKKLRFPRVR
jgi:hypothetical protein